MFKKHPFIKIDFLPNGKFLLKTNFQKNTDPRPIAEFINGLLTRELLKEFMEAIYNSSSKNKAKEIGEIICEEVFMVQKDFHIKSIVNKRNPLIRPSEVMNKFLSGVPEDE